MRRLAVLATLGLVSAAGCGTDLSGLGGDTCSTAPAELSRIASSCTLRAGSNVVIEVQPDCQRCGESSPSCGSELVNNVIELTPIYRTCQGDSSCPTTQCGARFTCNVSTPPQSGTFTVNFPTANGGLGSASVQVSASGDTSCSL